MTAVTARFNGVCACGGAVIAHALAGRERSGRIRCGLCLKRHQEHEARERQARVLASLNID